MVKKQKRKSLEKYATTSPLKKKFKFKEGQKVGLYVKFDGEGKEIALSLAKFKILRLRPNGTMVLKLVGEFEEGF